MRKPGNGVPEHDGVKDGDAEMPDGRRQMTKHETEKGTPETVVTSVAKAPRRRHWRTF